MSIAGDILNRGMEILVATHSMETVTVAGTNYSCFVMESTVGNDYELGGFTSQDMHRLAIPRSLITTIPTEGNAVTFRSTSYRVQSVQRDDAESAIVITVAPTTKRGNS